MPRRERRPPGRSWPDSPPALFRLGAVAGTAPGRWIDTWRERMPRTPLELVPLSVSAQHEALSTGAVDAALVRLPVDREHLHVIVLYEEVTVVVANAESHLLAVDELDVADLAGEAVIVPADDVLHVGLPAAVTTDDTGEAIALAAAGAGIVITPMSLARLHRRRDAGTRPLRDAPASTVALAWPKDASTPAVETFVGIVRGRTAKSSR